MTGSKFRQAYQNMQDALYEIMQRNVSAVIRAA
jgi:hypothetical protein